VFCPALFLLRTVLGRWPVNWQLLALATNTEILKAQLAA